ncbi:hypothetical protein AAG747_12175 [Rapidithrix thailandica]|uniref:Uncharacterized protein n=1 Tax=Rapidithrix thailandica TaxID=413964 RepID=A0AAW9RY09_9BACT
MIFFYNNYIKLHSQQGIREMWMYNKKRQAWIAILVSLILIWLFAHQEKVTLNFPLPQKQEVLE